MKVNSIIAVLVLGALTILGACVSPATKTPSTSAPVIVSPPKPATFITTNLKAPSLPESVYETVEVSVTVTNIGEQEGTYTAVLRIDGDITGTQNVTLAGGASRDVVFAIPVMSSIRAYIVTIDQLVATLQMPEAN